MAEKGQETPQEALKQPPLFAPDGTPSPEVIKAMKQLEDQQNREYQIKKAEEIEYLTWERHKDHAP